MKATNYTMLLMLGIAGLAEAQTYRRVVPGVPGPYYQPRRYVITPTPSTSRPATTRSESSTPAGGPIVLDRPTVLQSPGSFALAGNIGAASDATTAAIVIASPDVTLDLGGYTISSRGSKDGNAGGIAIMADRVTVRNGNLQGFDFENQFGIAVGAGARSFTIENVNVAECDTGILLNADNVEDLPVSGGRISKVQVSGGAVGILAFESEGIVIENCIITGASARRQIEGEGSGALLRGTGFIMRDSTFMANAHGLRLEGDYSMVENCSFTRNRNTGINLRGAGCVVRDSVLSGNGLLGAVVIGSGCSFEDTSFHANAGHGLALDTGDELVAEATSVSDCRFTANAGDGLADRGRGSTSVVRSYVIGNGGVGLNLLPTSTYKDCTLSDRGGEARGGVDGGGNAKLPAP